MQWIFFNKLKFILLKNLRKVFLHLLDYMLANRCALRTPTMVTRKKNFFKNKGTGTYRTLYATNIKYMAENETLLLLLLLLSYLF